MLWKPPLGNREHHLQSIYAWVTFYLLLHRVTFSLIRTTLQSWLTFNSLHALCCVSFMTAPVPALCYSSPLALALVHTWYFESTREMSVPLLTLFLTSSQLTTPKYITSGIVFTKYSFTVLTSFLAFTIHLVLKEQFNDSLAQYCTLHWQVGTVLLSNFSRLHFFYSVKRGQQCPRKPFNPSPHWKIRSLNGIPSRQLH